MRIALVTDGIWPYVLGGMQKHSYYLCKYLAANSVHVDLYHYNSSSSDIDQLQHFSAGERAFIHPVVLTFPRSARFPGHYIYDSYRYAKIAGSHLLASGKQYDLIYTKGFAGWFLLEQSRQVRAKLGPIGVNFHGYEMFQKAPGIKSLLQYIFFLRIPVKRLSNKADVVFSYGGKITPIIESLGIPRSRIIEMPTGVESSSIADGIMPSTDITRFVFLGRYERRKGIEELNSAISLLDPSLKKLSEFHFIGPIPGSKQNSGCIYHGAVMDADRLRRLLRGCDVLVCPSWSEGMPNVILEAMSQGLAVVATNTGATSTMVHQGNGWLLASADPAAIRSTLEMVIRTPREKLDEKKHCALRLISSELVWEKIAPRFIAQVRSFAESAKRTAVPD